MSWYDYPKSTPHRVAGGMKTRRQHGMIGENWWSKRWVHVLDELGLGTRLARGRNYARTGQVMAIDIQSGYIQARVQGSRPRPYTVEIRLHPLSDQDWDQVSTRMATQALFAAKLLAGEMPTDVEETFHAANLSLFPVNAGDLSTNCTCPDWANPCKHTAAVYYILAERFDDDPFLLFKLRGRTKEAFLDTLRKKRAATLSAEHPTENESTLQEPQEAGEPLLRPEDLISTFWQAGPALTSFQVNPRPPELQKAVLRRLGEPPFSLVGQKVAPILSEAYDRVYTATRQKANEVQAEIAL